MVFWDTIVSNFISGRNKLFLFCSVCGYLLYFSCSLRRQENSLFCHVNPTNVPTYICIMSHDERQKVVDEINAAKKEKWWNDKNWTNTCCSRRHRFKDPLFDVRVPLSSPVNPLWAKHGNTLICNHNGILKRGCEYFDKL